MSRRSKQGLPPPPASGEEAPLTEVVRDAGPIFELAGANVLLADPRLRVSDGRAIVDARCTRASIHPRTFTAVQLGQILRHASRRVYDGDSGHPADPLGERHTLLVPIDPTNAGHDAIPGFLVIEGRPQVVEIVRQCLTQARARGAGGA